MVPRTEALDHARSLFRQRRSRDAHFSADLFGEPAWDLLLTLYIARCEDRYLSIPALSLSLNLSLAEASKWVCRLEASRLIQKVSSINASESSSVCISNTGFDTITRMLLERPVRMLS